MTNPQTHLSKAPHLSLSLPATDRGSSILHEAQARFCQLRQELDRCHGQVSELEEIVHCLESEMRRQELTHTAEIRLGLDLEMEIPEPKARPALPPPVPLRNARNKPMVLLVVDPRTLHERNHASQIGLVGTLLTALTLTVGFLVAIIALT